jgi:tyrosine decarboxylase / aspartate 1-decarboxylase
VALWATQQLLPLTPEGEFARGLRSGRASALELDRRIRQESRFEALAAGFPELDIVVWKLKAASAESASERAQNAFTACALRDLHLALVQLPLFWFQTSATPEDGHVTCLRSVLMKPEHEAWMDAIWDRLSSACTEILGSKA